jgi:hypothetical protein
MPVCLCAPRLSPEYCCRAETPHRGQPCPSFALLAHSRRHSGGKRPGRRHSSSTWQCMARTFATARHSHVRAPACTKKWVPTSGTGQGTPGATASGRCASSARLILPPSSCLSTDPCPPIPPGQVYPGRGGLDFPLQRFSSLAQASFEEDFCIERACGLGTSPGEEKEGELRVRGTKRQLAGVPGRHYGGMACLQYCSVRVRLIHLIATAAASAASFIALPPLPLPPPPHSLHCCHCRCRCLIQLIATATTSAASGRRRGGRCRHGGVHVVRSHCEPPPPPYGDGIQ